ncbi:putative MFS transporter [Mycena sanguinolenta]|uniref:Putative MFS transporter n=1 Tax=Mycena sanguinolenta TaxID=230812 RepID=A0A8H6XUC5_9AGAR|nr:putative MFS transporter [Mycena sanguinolenta]
MACCYPSLQRALFFEPDPLSSLSQLVRNPLLIETFSPFFAPWESISLRWPGSLDTFEAMPWSKAPDAFKRKAASWRRMLVSQPPVQTLIITQQTSGMTGTSERRAVLNDLPLRMGILYDLTLPLIDDDVVCFRIHWRGIKVEGNLLLEVSAGYGCMDDLSRKLDEQFRSDGEQFIEVPFGKWETRVWD